MFSKCVSSIVLLPVVGGCNSIRKILVRLDHFPNFWGEHEKYVKPPPRYLYCWWFQEIPRPTTFLDGQKTNPSQIMGWYFYHFTWCFHLVPDCGFLLFFSGNFGVQRNVQLLVRWYRSAVGCVRPPGHDAMARLKAWWNLEFKEKLFLVKRNRPRVDEIFFLP